jgi:hypothetical protein
MDMYDFHHREKTIQTGGGEIWLESRRKWNVFVE